MILDFSTTISKSIVLRLSKAQCTYAPEIKPVAEEKGIKPNVTHKSSVQIGRTAQERDCFYSETLHERSLVNFDNSLEDVSPHSESTF